MHMKRKQTITVAAIVIFGAIASAFILGTNRSKPAGDDHGHGAGVAHAEHGAGGAHVAGEAKKGSRGGKLFVDGDFSLEVTIFETGVEPEFRLYTYLKGKPVDPTGTTATITLERLGRNPQPIQFTKVADYLKGNAVIEEPHSFEVKVAAQREGKTHRFAYAQEEARVAMSDAQTKEAGIEIKLAGPAKIKSSLQLIGDIKLNGDRTVLIVPRLAGVVESANANAGDVVKKGQVLAVIFSPALADQRGELLAAQKRLALAQATYEREKKLFEGKISAEQDFLQARNAMSEAEITVRGAQQKLSSIGGLSGGSGNLTRYEIRAPISGTIVEKNLSVGQAIKEDANIFMLADLTSVWAEMMVYAKDMNVIRVGQKVIVKSAEFDSSASGVVSYVGALAGEQTRTAKARVVLPNPNNAWRPGLAVNIEVEAAESEVPVAVSADAIQTLRDWSVVFGRYDNAFEARPLKLGRSDGKMVEVLKGLSAGEKYAARNSYVIKADIGKAGASHDH
jgi:membrane fusion protein, heavy metal efflux system